jgi:hypothetical protein
MPQDRDSGAAASRYGHEWGERVAAALGAQKLRRGSNECMYKGERVVIKCAHQRRVQSVGVTYLMLERLAAVLGAFEQPDGSYRVIRLAASRFASAMRPTRSRGASAGRVGVVKRAVFEQHGSTVAILRI